MTEEEHKRKADDALIVLASELGEVRGVQAQILDTLNKQWEKQKAEDIDHAKIKAHLQEMMHRMSDVPQDKHHAHHDFMEELINAQRERAEVCRRIRNIMIERALPFAFLAMIAFGMYMIGAKESAITILGKMKP